MRLITGLVAIALIAFSSFANAEEEVVGKTKSGKKIVKRDMDKVYADSSEFHRQNKQGSVIVESGLAVGAIATSGFAGGYYFKPDSLIELSHVSGGYEFLGFGINASLTSLRLKKWWGNSFYTNLGLASRTIGIKSDLTPVAGGSTIKADLSVNSFGIDFAIGNRWQWEYFTIGCDWIGTFAPLSNSGDSEVTLTGISASDKADLEKTMDDLGNASSTQLLRFYLGVSF